MLAVLQLPASGNAHVALGEGSVESRHNCREPQRTGI